MDRVTLVRILAGFAVGPIAPGLLFALGCLVLGNSYGGSHWIALAFRIGYPVALIFGIPAFLFMQWKGWTGARAYTIAGSLLGLVPCCIVVPAAIGFAGGLDAMEDSQIESLGEIVALAFFCGAVAGLCFWIIARPAGLPGTARLST